MAETYVSRPHFEELTLDSGKVRVLQCVVFEIVLFSANRPRRGGAHPAPLWTPHLSTEFWANVLVRRQPVSFSEGQQNHHKSALSGSWTSSYSVMCYANVKYIYCSVSLLFAFRYRFWEEVGVCAHRLNASCACFLLQHARFQFPVMTANTANKVTCLCAGCLHRTSQGEQGAYFGYKPQQTLSTFYSAGKI